MKILYIVSRPLELNTSASLRNINTINGLASMGHSIDVITSEYSKHHNNYAEVALNKNVKNIYLKSNGIKKIASLTHSISWFKKIRKVLFKKMNQLNIYDNYKSILNNIESIDFRNKGYNLIISSSDPKSSHLFTLELITKQKIEKVPWIQIWGDPFVNDITRDQNQKVDKVVLEEKRLLNDASSIIYLSNLTLLEQKRNYPEYEKKMFFIPRAYDKKIIYSEKLRDELDELTLVYCGDYNTNVRNLRPLYEAVIAGDEKLTVCGYSDKPLDATEKVTVNTRVSFSKVLELEEESDVLVHLSNLRGTQIPGKIYQYSATNKTILFILDGNVESVKEEFQKYNRYVFCENNVESIKDALKRIKKSKNLPNQMPIKEFSKEVVTKKILSTLDENI